MLPSHLLPPIQYSSWRKKKINSIQFETVTSYAITTQYVIINEIIKTSTDFLVEAQETHMRHPGLNRKYKFHNTIWYSRVNIDYGITQSTSLLSLNFRFSFPFQVFDQATQNKAFNDLMGTICDRLRNVKPCKEYFRNN